MSTINRHLLYAICVFFGLLILGGACVTWPKYRQHRDAVAEQQRLRLRTRDINVHTRALEGLEEEVVTLRQRVEREHKHIPPSADTHEVITTLSVPINADAVQEPTFTTGTPAPALQDDQSPTVWLAPLGVTMRADFDAIFSILRTAERMDRLVRIRSLQLTVPSNRSTRRGGAGGAGGADDPASAADPSKSLVATLDLEVLYQPDGQRQAFAGQ